MKRFLVMVVTVLIAIVLYIVGCGIIDKATALKPDVEYNICVQPDFTNSVRSW